MATSTDGKNVYALGVNDHTLVVFARDPTTGQLTSSEVFQDDEVSTPIQNATLINGLKGSGGVAVSDDGKNVYVVGFNTVSVFTRNADNGRLSLLEQHIDGSDGVNGIGVARDLLVSPDGHHVYIGGMEVVFRRDAATGELTFRGMYRAPEVTGYLGSYPVDGLRGGFGFPVSSAAISGDGRHVFAASSADGAIAVFERDAESGGLSFRQALQTNTPRNRELDGVPSPAAIAGATQVEGLSGAAGITVSDDGLFVYVASSNDHAIISFLRDTNSGELTMLETIRDTAPGVDGLDGPRALSLSPDGRRLFVASANSGATAFRRDPSTGLLTFAENHIDEQNGIDNLAFASTVVISSDGGHLYVAASDDDAIAIFDATTVEHEVSLGSSESLTDLNFGIYQAPRLRGESWKMPTMMECSTARNQAWKVGRSSWIATMMTRSIPASHEAPRTPTVISSFQMSSPGPTTSWFEIANLAG